MRFTHAYCCFCFVGFVIQIAKTIDYLPVHARPLNGLTSGWTVKNLMNILIYVSVA